MILKIFIHIIFNIYNFTVDECSSRFNISRPTIIKYYQYFRNVIQTLTTSEFNQYKLLTI